EHETSIKQIQPGRSMVKHPPPHKEAAQENKSPFSSFQFVSAPPLPQSFNLKYFSFILRSQ
ncbi:hypothetical protein, partial [Salmonella enterica]